MRLKIIALCRLLAASVILSATAFAATFIGTVVRVIDGDTITVNSAGQMRKIRLIGIDAPESRQEFGHTSRDHLAELILGKEVAVIWNKTDRYGRILGVVTIGATDANLEQLKAGYAWYYRAYESDVPEIERCLYAAAETAAKSQKAGLWSQPNPVAPWAWRRQKRVMTAK